MPYLLSCCVANMPVFEGSVCPLLDSEAMCGEPRMGEMNLITDVLHSFGKKKVILCVRGGT